MNRSLLDNIAYFIAFCVEIYKKAHFMTGAEVADIFSRHGILEYLADNYEVLHTQGHNWILAEIKDQIKNTSR